MVYDSVSIDRVIGKVIRDTRVQDMAYVIDMNVWIPEVMRDMRWEAPLSQEYQDVKIVFHKGRMPVGLNYIDAIEHCGHRLSHGNSVKNIRTGQRTDNHVLHPETWTSGVTKTPTPDGNGIFMGTLTKVMALPVGHHYYQMELDHIVTSFSDGWVRVHFKTTPKDERGLPLIPNNQSFIECCYWYSRMKMIGAGWEDPVFKYEHCEQRYKDYMVRAMAEIDMPSPDQMEERVNTFARLVPPENYYENYFRVTRPEPFYDPLGPRDSYFI